MCDAPQLVTAPQLAERLSMKVGTVRDLARRRGWPCYRIGRAVRFDLVEVLPFLREEGAER